MRRNIELYISDRRVDLDAEALILFNYRFEDLGNPTIVRNSYSQAVTIPGTDSNNALFGEIFRADRRQSGTGFDPKRKTPFQIFSDGSLLEAGYAKLEGVDTEGGTVHGYRVGLYGGLGSFFYALSYDENGNKRDLASLVYPFNLEFLINRYTVADAWAHLTPAPYQPRARWDIVNFAPCYNGIPTADFAADKIIVKPAGVGLPTQQTSGDKVYGPKGGADGLSLVTLGRKVNEWEAHDLRSYLQRAVLRFRAILDACCDPAQNGGFTVDLDPTFFNDDNAYYDKLWLTLPQIHKLNGLTDGGDGTFEVEGEGLEDFAVNIDLALPFGVDVTASTAASFYVEMQDDPGEAETLYAARLVLPAERVQYESYAWLVQLVGYDGNGAAVASSPVEIIQTAVGGIRFTAAEVAAKIRYETLYNGGFDQQNLDGEFVKSGGSWTWSKQLRLNLSGRNVTGLDLRVTPVHIIADNAESFTATGLVDDFIGLWRFRESNLNPALQVSLVGVAGIAGGNTYEYSKAAAVRSGARITQAALLSTDYTPADYLIAYAKLFGLQFVTDREGKTIRIMTRSTFFAEHAADVIDLTQRVDRSQQISSTPFSFATKWLELSFEEDEVEWAKEYLTAYGRKYGAARINTGFEFNSETAELLKDIPFKGGVEVLERSKMFNNVTEGGKPVPSAFLDGGQYTLYSGTESKAFPLTVPTAAAVISYWNDDYPSYDRYPRAQYHAADQKELDLRDSLLFYRGTVYRDGEYWQEGGFLRIRITDDDQNMAELNDNVPCWSAAGDGLALQNFPLFGRYIYSGSEIVRSLDFSMPAELDIPGVTFAAGAGIYERFWRRYLLDRYDDDARVTRMRVDLSGLSVGVELLRRFFYYDGALWMLNAIENHSLTTFDPTECEFVKVIDIENYTDGQTPEGSAITAYPTAVELDPYGGTAVVTVTADGGWTVEAVDLPAEITLDRQSGWGPSVVTITAAPNADAEVSGSLLFRLNATGATVRVAVTQRVMDEITVTPASITFGAEGYYGNDAATVEIDTGGSDSLEWEITAVPSWLIITTPDSTTPVTRGTGPAVLVFAAAPNPTKQERLAEVLFTFTGGAFTRSVPISIRQTGEAYTVIEVQLSAALDVTDDTFDTFVRVIKIGNLPAGVASSPLLDFVAYTNTEIGLYPNFSTVGEPSIQTANVVDDVDPGVINRRRGQLVSARNLRDYAVENDITPRGGDYTLPSFVWLEAEAYAYGNTWRRTHGLRFEQAGAAIVPTITATPATFEAAQDGGGIDGELQTLVVECNTLWDVATVDVFDPRLIVDDAIYGGIASMYPSQEKGAPGRHTFQTLFAAMNAGASDRTFRVALYTGRVEAGRIVGGAIALLTVQQYHYSWTLAESSKNIDNRAQSLVVEPIQIPDLGAVFTAFDPGVDWLTVSPLQGSAAATQIQIQVAANATGSQRAAYVTIVNTFNQEFKRIFISQSA